MTDHSIWSLNLKLSKKLKNKSEFVSIYICTGFVRGFRYEYFFGFVWFVICITQFDIIYQSLDLTESVNYFNLLFIFQVIVWLNSVCLLHHNNIFYSTVFIENIDKKKSQSHSIPNIITIINHSHSWWTNS